MIPKVFQLYSKRRNKKLQCYEWWKNFFDQPINNMIKTFGDIRKITIGQGDDYTTGCLLDYTYIIKWL